MQIAELIAKYSGPAPRYTSYPTAPHFSGAVDGAVYAEWLGGLDELSVLSLYLHVPFCASLCRFCGCHTTAVRSEAALHQYADTLLREIGLLAAALGLRRRVCHVHWGGGTPTALPPRRLSEIMRALGAAFAFDADAEIAVELDPRVVSAPVLDALAEMGCTRASLGVQDFDPAVQRVIGRVQSFEETRNCAEGLRQRGIARLNLDLIYGLPLQTEASVIETAERALALAPDRIAVFGYAHVPWMKRHQALLPEDRLPDAVQRWRQRDAIDAVIVGRGWRPIGLDHYALPGDSMCRAAEEKRLRRNFQGYTTDTAPVLLGIGASSIGCLPQGYVQNAAAVPEWRAMVRDGGLPVVRGIAVDDEDRLRRGVIEALMCEGRVDLDAVAAERGADAATLKAAAPALEAFARDGLADWDGRVVTMRREALPFVRHVAAALDSYRASGGRHSAAI